MRKRVLVCGYFGWENNQLDGQTIKTRNIYDLLKSKESEINFNIKPFDTQTFQKSKFNLFKMFTEIRRSNILVYLPAHNNLKYIFPFIYFLCKIFNTKIHYIVVGGWLAGFIENKPLHVRLLRNIEGIYPQTKDLCIELENKYDFKNVFQLNNFRIINDQIVDAGHHTDNDQIRLVFVARVHPMKGVNVLFLIAEKLKTERYDNVFIDIYGPVSESYIDNFKLELSEKTNIFYKGILDQDKLHSVLVHYDLMLFPTKYFTEGFPGSILDAYIAGVPVIVTHWKYAEEFVQEGINGNIANFDDDDDFIEKVINLVVNPQKLECLKETTKGSAHKYSPQSAWLLLKENIFNQ